MSRGIDEGDDHLDYQYGCARDTELYEMMLAQLIADRTAAGELRPQPPRARQTPAVTDAGADASTPDLAPMHLWLISEGMARGDPRLDWRAECALLVYNRWVPVLYDADEPPWPGGRAWDDEYNPDGIDEDSPVGCRNRLIALLGVLDGPDVIRNFDVDGFVADIRTVTGGNDPLSLSGDAFLSMAERRRFAGR